MRHRRTAGAGSRPAPLADQSLAEPDRAVSLNLRCAQALLPGMEAAGFGFIVGASSRAALGEGRRSVHAASKAGLQDSARVRALGLGPHGIIANPPDSARTRAILDAVPVRRAGTAAV